MGQTPVSIFGAKKFDFGAVGPAQCSDPAQRSDPALGLWLGVALGLWLGVEPVVRAARLR